MNNTETILKGKNIEKYYGQQQVLNIDSISFYQGKFNLLIGPNGSGKTTLINIMSHVDIDYNGHVFFQNQEITSSNIKTLQIRRKFSIIWQNPYLYRGTVALNIGLPLKLRGLDQEIITKRVRKIAEKLKITHLLNKDSREISGGEKQKTSIARALINEPEVLFMDEPNNNLDYKSKRFFNQIYQELVADGMTVILVSHDLYQIENMADYIFIINKGQITRQGDNKEIAL